MRAAIADVKDVYIPGGNRELLEAAAIFYGVTNHCEIPLEKDLSRYYIKTTAGGDYIALVDLKAECSDPGYVPQLQNGSYWACGNMWRDSGKYPNVRGFRLCVERIACAENKESPGTAKFRGSFRLLLMCALIPAAQSHLYPPLGRSKDVYGMATL